MCLLVFFVIYLRPIYTGFFFKIWDHIFGTVLSDPCTCFDCRPARSLKMWEDIVKPDYSVLLSPKWWLVSNSTASADAVPEADKNK